MDRAGDSAKALGAYESLLVVQTRKGVLRELLGSETTNEFKIYPSKEQSNEAQSNGDSIFYSLEESTFCCRFFCKNQRAFTQTVWKGTKDQRESVIMTMKKEKTCPVAPCQGCCIPAISYFAADGSPMGSASVPCHFCLPSISVKDPSGNDEYAIQMPSCCGGVCVDESAEGHCSKKIPFYIYPPGKGAKGEEIGKIIKLWRGFWTETFTDADSFQIEFPKGIDETAKARVLGSVFFINMLFFEKAND